MQTVDIIEIKPVLRRESGGYTLLVNGQYALRTVTAKSKASLQQAAERFKRRGFIKVPSNWVSILED